MIQNPILRGICPDPSIIRVGQDYYIATSTFEWWPGVRLFHSKDLSHWEQLRSPLRRYSQLDLTGDPPSGGVWAPCLSHDGQKFYLVYTDVKTKKGRFYNTHNYLITADDIRGEWSDPVYLNSIGFDPSLFHDCDGKKYLVNMVNGFKGILVQEYDPVSQKLVGERKKVYGGSGLGFTEGPHMYHIGDWYYLIVAEGGTSYEHCVTMARSRSVWGPFETAPDNPILTSDRQTPGALQKCGHADFTDTPDGEWYLVHLCSRPLDGENLCPLGRETAIQKMTWTEDGWLALKSGGRFAQIKTEGPAKVSVGTTESAVTADSSVNASSMINSSADDPSAEEIRKQDSFRDDFHNAALHVRYSAPRRNYEEFADCTARPGYLRITGQESLNSLHRVSLLAVRQQALHAVAETAMEFHPRYPEQLAGLAYMYDALHFYILGKTVSEDGQTVLTLLKSDKGVITDEITPIPLNSEEEISLKACVTPDGREVSFFYSEGDDWHQAGGSYSTKILTDDYCVGFTGAHFGMYAHDMTGLAAYADFHCFSVNYKTVE